MIKKITNEEIARVFAMYGESDARIFREGENNDKCYKYLGHSINYSELFIWNIQGGGTSVKPEHLKLLLTPLSEITDRDAKRIGEIIYSDVRSEEIKLAKDFILYEFDAIPLNPYERKCISLFQDGECFLQTTDFLKERGYALPYKGESLFKLGIAIDKKY